MGSSTYWNGEDIDLTHLTPEEWDTLCDDLLAAIPESAGASDDPSGYDNIMFAFTRDGEQIITLPEGKDISYGLDDAVYGAVLISQRMKQPTTWSKPDSDGYAKGDTDVMLSWEGDENEDKGYVILTADRGALVCYMVPTYPIAAIHRDTVALDEERAKEKADMAELEAARAKVEKDTHNNAHGAIAAAIDQGEQLDLVREHLKEYSGAGGHSNYQTDTIKPSRLVVAHQRAHEDMEVTA